MVAMVEMQSILLEMVTRVFTHAQHWLWEVLVWLVDEEGERIVKTIGELQYKHILTFIVIKLIQAPVIFHCKFIKTSL